MKVTGCTVHVATEEVDAGPILAQEAVAVLPDDTEESLHERIKAVERRLYPTSPSRVLNVGVTVRALLSVYDKTGIVDLARGLHELGIELVSQRRHGPRSGRGRHPGHRRGRHHRGAGDPRPPGRDAAPQGARRPPRRPRRPDAPGRHGALRHRADRPRRVNLYPFSTDPAIELIDIGGPAMVRAAAKNHAHVGVVIDPARVRRGARGAAASSGALSATTPGGGWPGPPSPTPPPTTPPIVAWFDAATEVDRRRPATPLPADAPPRRSSGARRCATARTRTRSAPATAAVGEHGWWDDAVQHGGKEMSYLNVYDTEAAWRLVHSLGDRAGVR